MNSIAQIHNDRESSHTNVTHVPINFFVKDVFNNNIKENQNRRF